ncbi:MAG: hypothetical protein ABIF77_06175 [bacterium]
MEWEPNERDAWVADAERWIIQIPGVRQCKIDLDNAGEVTGVHVVTGMEREPRHIVRDVEGLLKARLDCNVYYKKIGVVQVVDNGVESGQDPLAFTPGELAELPDGLGVELNDAVLLEEVAPPRIQCNGVGVLTTDTTIRAEVNLQVGLVEARGIAEGPNHVGGDLGLIAKAAVTALGELLAEPVLLHLSEVRLEQAAGESIVLAAVELVEGRRSERLFGTCPAAHNRQQAVAYAILDALNRRLALMEFKTGEDTD